MNFKTIYASTFYHASTHVDRLAEKIQTSSDLHFFQLRFTQLLMKVFTSLLTFIAAGYELIAYCFSLNLSRFITATSIA